MLVLHTMPRLAWGDLSPSPFCAKVEAYLRLADLPYEARPTLSASAAPKKKLPWIEDDGVPIADSGAILAHLIATRGDPLGDLAIDAAEAARRHLLRRTVEESLYFLLVAERWLDPDVAPAYQRDLLAAVPALMRPVVGAMASRMLRRQLWEQGSGRHSLPEVRARAADDLAALAAALGDGPYFAGDRPGAIDTTVWGSLANLWLIPVDTPLRQAVGAHPALVAYVDRLRARLAGQTPPPVPDQPTDRS